MIRLLRLALGLMVAFVFAGRVEAATLHCVRLAHEASALSGNAAEPCHMTDMGLSTHASAHHAPSQHGQTVAACECIAFAKSVSAPAPLVISSRIAAFAWERPETERFASLDLAPDGPPPKA